MKVGFKQVPPPHQGVLSATVYNTHGIHVAVQRVVDNVPALLEEHNHADTNEVELLHLAPWAHYPGLDPHKVSKDVYAVRLDVNDGLHAGRGATSGEWLSIKVPADKYLDSDVSFRCVVHNLADRKIVVSDLSLVVDDILGDCDMLGLPFVHHPTKYYRHADGSYSCFSPFESSVGLGRYVGIEK